MSAKLEEDLRNAADMGRLEQVKELVEKRGVNFRAKDKEVSSFNIIFCFFRNIFILSVREMLCIMLLEECILKL